VSNEIINTIIVKSDTSYDKVKELERLCVNHEACMVLDFEKILPSPVGGIYTHEKGDKYMTDELVEWCYKNWGTKWPAREGSSNYHDLFNDYLWGTNPWSPPGDYPHGGMIEFVFSTANGSCDGIVYELAKRFPELEFEHHHKDTQNPQDAGVWVYKNGERKYYSYRILGKRRQK
jgi:hypothetical protein